MWPVQKHEDQAPLAAAAGRHNHAQNAFIQPTIEGVGQ